MAKRKKDARERLNQKKKRTGMIISVFLSFLFILLTSSFVLRYIYRGAANATVTQEGIAQVYRAAMGDTAFVSDTQDEDEEYENEQKDQDDFDNEILNNSSDFDSKSFTDGSGIYTENSPKENSSDKENSSESNENSNNSDKFNSNSNETEESEDTGNPITNFFNNLRN